MKRRLVFVLSLALIVFAVSTTTPQPAQCADQRCDTVRSLCNGQMDLLAQLRLAMGNSAQKCVDDAARFWAECMDRNDCPVNN